MISMGYNDDTSKIRKMERTGKKPAPSSVAPPLPLFIEGIRIYLHRTEVDDSNDKRRTGLHNGKQKNQRQFRIVADDMHR